MIYVFDTSSIRSLQHFYPSVFKTIWDGLEKLVEQRSLISTREVFNELQPNAAKIPNVCAHFKIPCIDLEEFMHRQGWTF